MKIVAVGLFEYELAYVGGPYTLSKGRVIDVQPALVVRLETDDGHVGWGETAPLGRNHLPSFIEGERAALKLLAEAVVGLDPREFAVVQAAMAQTLLAGLAAKCAIDIACWDLAGKAAGMPVAKLLGGLLQPSFPVWDSIPLVEPELAASLAEKSAATGAKHFQVKVGGDPAEDARRVQAVLEAAAHPVLVIADANGGWTLAAALHACQSLEGLPVHLEQPCATMRDCAEVRRACSLPMMLDEVIVTLDDLVSAKLAGATGVNVKPSRVGGLTPARLLRDAACAMGMVVTIDDSWGGAITTAALSHLAASTPAPFLLAATFFSELAHPMIAAVQRRGSDGMGGASSLAGLGFEIRDTAHLRRMTR